MKKRRKICVVTGSRAEYGLLYWLIKEIRDDSCLKLQIIATGMHLSPEFGLTYKEIEKDFKIDRKIEILLSSDTPIGVSKAMGLAQISFAEAYDELKPDIVVVLGDRFEIFCAASAAMIARIPIAHLHGGETTQGAFDEAIRHSITKMSHIHFVATEQYRNRVIQLGEHPNQVFNFGAIGIDSINNMRLLSLHEFEKSINFKLGKHNLMITFHPATLDSLSTQKQFKYLLDALDQLSDTHLIFTKSNADVEGRSINTMIDEYAKKKKKRVAAFITLGQLKFLSAMQFVDGVIGNSSSGIIEAPSFKIGTINIGDRQQGRIRATSVIDCKTTTASISNAIRKLYSRKFKKRLLNVVNPYGNGEVSVKIKNVIKNQSLHNIMIKKFYDIPITFPN